MLRQSLWWSSCGLVASADLTWWLQSMFVQVTSLNGPPMMTSVWPDLLAMWRQLWTIATSCRFMIVPQNWDCRCTLTLILEVPVTWSQHQGISLRLKVLDRLRYPCGAANDKEQFLDQLRRRILYHYQLLMLTRQFQCLRFARSSSSMKWCWTAMRTTQLFSQSLPGIWASFTASMLPQLVWHSMSQASMQNTSKRFNSEPMFSPRPSALLRGILHSSFFRWCRSRPEAFNS